ncbi:glycosyltransferase family 4 protein [Candidatus Uhrbacteria bacterium]|nr:glycosyltransferase family 4 protein [Candidatus Uhrbacteria bacterium]
MKVVYLLTYLDSQTGGMERQALQLAKKLREKGHEIFFITCAHLSRMRQEHLRLIDTKEGFRVYRIPFFGGVRYLNMVLYGIGTLILLFLMQKQYRIIHAHQLYTSGVVGAFAKLFLRSKKLIVKNCCGGEFSDVKFLKQLPGFPFVMRRMRRAVDRWIAISDETQREMQAERLGRIIYIPNGVDTAYFHPKDVVRKSTLREKMKIDPHDKVVLFIGKFDPQKNIPVLLKAMGSVGPNVHLLIVGTGSLRPILERYVATNNLHKKVTFCGAVSDTKEYYQIADLFVLPSRAEGLSNVLLEAMSSGLPCIGSDIAGIRAVVAHGVNGYLVPLDDASAFAWAITRVFAQPEEARRTGDAARASVIKRFSLDSVAQSYVRLYETLVS